MREIVHMQAGQCGNQIGAKVSHFIFLILLSSSTPGSLHFSIKRRGPFFSIYQCFGGRLFLFNIAREKENEEKIFKYYFHIKSLRSMEVWQKLNPKPYRPFLYNQQTVNMRKFEGNAAVI